MEFRLPDWIKPYYREEFDVDHVSSVIENECGVRTFRFIESCTIFLLFFFLWVFLFLGFLNISKKISSSLFLVAIKEEEEDDYWLDPKSPMVEHDYFNRDEFKPTTTASPLNKHQPQFIDNLQRTTPASPSIRRRPSSLSNSGRTFAPTQTGSKLMSPKPGNVKPKLKQQKPKVKIMWTDFPYSPSELDEMPVEKFNEIIKQLDEVRQHIAKDERRKGKNKLAARNCRKRKMDVIESLDQGVNSLEQRRINLMEERQRILEETRQIKICLLYTSPSPRDS